MTIDTSGKWWTGSSPGDLEEYLQSYSADSYPIHAFRLAKCPCGSESFDLHVERDEGIAKRTCAQCGAKHWIADSAENYEKGLRLTKYKCITCKGSRANVGVGFSLMEDGACVRWLYVGNRCVDCGVLGSMADWKVGYDPSLHLLDEV